MDKFISSQPSATLLKLVFTFLRNPRPVLTAALLAAFGVTNASAVTIQQPHDAGLARAKKTPFSFVGRVFDVDFIAFGSGSLIRRHTVLTAGHVLYDPTLGFTTSTIFDRALYESYRLQSSQVVSVATLSGYQNSVDTSGNTSTTSFAQDQGYLLLGSAPVDENWANFTSNPDLLTRSTSQFFVMGYPGVTFDGRTLAYIVPTTPFVPAGTATATGSYINTDYLAEEGMSGGPIFLETDNTLANATVAADTVGGVPDTSGEFTISYVRAIDKTSKKFLTAAEYTSGLISGVQITGPATAARGSTVNFTVQPVFKKGKTTTDRYPELKLKLAVGTAATTGVTIKKLSNTTFAVTFANVTAVRSGSTIQFQVIYDKNTVVPGTTSTASVKIQ